MEITDSKNFYTLKFDKERNICYETPVGFWTKDDYLRYHDDYTGKISKALNGKPWAKQIDLRNYKVSNITDEIQMHADWMEKNKVTTIAVVVSSAIAKMQMNRAGDGKFDQQAFTDEKEANEWLKSKGF